MNNQLKEFGKYLIEKELGHGGMGVVYKAYDKVLKIPVALKLIIKEDPKAIKRFLTEASATAKLGHPNIVRLYETGKHPRPFFTMEYIEGQTLSQLIKKSKIEQSYLIDTMIKLCDALHQAHQKNILHRDIKPSNIMITQQGQPKIMDFGLAKMDTEQSLSKTGEVLGTFAYMAPEQVNGKASRKSDIYSLGATLYEALTCRTLYQGETNANIMWQILKKNPIRPRELNPDISPYIEAICLKCLQKNPKKRYTDFKQLSRELKNFKSQKPIIARRYTKLDAIKYFIWQNKILFSAFLLVFTVMAISLALITNSLQKAIESNKALTKFNNAVVQSLNYTRKNNRYNKLLTTPGFRDPLMEVFQSSPKLRKEREYRFLRAIVLGQSKRVEDVKMAIADLSTLIADGDHSAINYTNRGYFYQQQKKYKLALLDYSKAIELNSKLAGSYYNRGNLYQKQRKYKQALEDYNKAINLNPGFTQSYYMRGILHQKLKKYQLALEDYNKIIQIDAKDIDAYYRRGNLFYIFGKYQLALKDYTQIIQIDPKNINAYFLRSHLYSRQKKDQEALSDYNKVIKLKPNSVKVYNSRGNLYQSQGKYQQALEDYNKAIEIDPKNTNAYHNRAALFYAQKQYQKAITDWELTITLGAPKELPQTWINKAKKLLK